MAETIEVEGGKYTIENYNGFVRIFRYRDFWKKGTKFDLAIFHELEAKGRELENWRSKAKDYTETLNETRRKRDEAKGKLALALIENKELKEERDFWKSYAPQWAIEKHEGAFE